MLRASESRKGEKMEDWKNSTIYTRADGSFVVECNGLPYHVPNEGEFAGMWEEISAYAAEHPGQVKPEPVLPPLPEDELFSMLRAHRDFLIAKTDYLFMSDYPISDAARAEWAAYRQALRDLPDQDGAPWDGGGEATPWPVPPIL